MFQLDHPDQEVLQAKETIRELNDQFRQTMVGGRVVMTEGISALSEVHLVKVVFHVVKYSQFTEDNDPHHEHDFGSFDCDGKNIFWKIDYYDKDCRFGSLDPADPAKTTRVLTILLASEY